MTPLLTLIANQGYLVEYNYDPEGLKGNWVFVTWALFSIVLGRNVYQGQKLNLSSVELKSYSKPFFQSIM